MAYLVTSTRASLLTVGGVDYTENLIDWVCSDTSAYKNGLIQTTGQLTLATIPGTSLEDYDRNMFKRGQKVILDITYPDGTTERHPRGLLYVVSAAYIPESEAIKIEIGCRIAMAALIDNTDALVSLPTVTLDPARKNDYQNISAALASEGKAAYQDNNGDLQVVSFFGGDNTSSYDPGEWVSVLGGTTLSVSPLAGASPLPDGIRLSYQVPADLDSIVDEEDQADQDSPNKVQIDEVDSYYFLTYPATVYVRTGDGDLPTGVSDGSIPTSVDSGCGNTPDKPGDNGQGSCNDNYTLSQTPLVIPAFRRQVSRTEYKGPSGQVSSRYSEVRGPAIEANQQYYSDKFAYCRYTWATACQPNGGCPTDGTEEILLGYTQQTNSYGPASQLLSTVTDTYIPTLAAAQPFDWRSGVVNGAPQNFTELSTTEMFRSQRRVEEFSREGNTNVTVTTVYTSSTARQSGISSGNIDALAGQKTKEIRRSTTITGNSVLPDTINSVETATEEKVTLIRIFGTSYITPPPEAGPYYMEESVPVPALYDTQGQIENFIEKYSATLASFVRGDALGLQIGETMRKDIASNWRPGMPFRYCDQYKNRISALRMDATSWSVNNTESLLVTSGIWIGFSDGTLSLGSNLVGNSTPSMGEGEVVPPTGTVEAPSVNGENNVSPGALAWEVDINIYTEVSAEAFGADGVVPPIPSGEEAEIDHHSTFMCYIRGYVVGAGSLSSPNGNGGIPLELGGSLLVSSPTIIDSDIFA